MAKKQYQGQFTAAEIDRYLAKARDMKEVTVDDTIDDTSENPVQNKAISAKMKEVTTAINGKQDALQSGTNIKTVNGESLLGSGNITVKAPSLAFDLDFADGCVYFEAFNFDQGTFSIGVDGCLYFST